MKLSSSSVMCLPLFSGLRNSSISSLKPHTQPVLIPGELQICARYWQRIIVGFLFFLPFPSSSPCFKFCVKSWRNCRESVRCLLGTGGVEVEGTASCHKVSVSCFCGTVGPPYCSCPGALHLCLPLLEPDHDEGYLRSSAASLELLWMFL